MMNNIKFQLNNNQLTYYNPNDNMNTSNCNNLFDYWSGQDYKYTVYTYNVTYSYNSDTGEYYCSSSDFNDNIIYNSETLTKIIIFSIEDKLYNLDYSEINLNNIYDIVFDISYDIIKDMIVNHTRIKEKELNPQIICDYFYSLNFNYFYDIVDKMI